jgi:hypothetical protein
MRAARCYDYFVCMADNATYVFDLDAKLVGIFDPALVAYEAVGAQNDKYVVLCGYDDQPSQILDIQWDDEEEEYDVRVQKVYLDEKGQTLVLRDAPAMYLIATTYAQRKRLERMREEFARRAALSEIPPEQQ